MASDRTEQTLSDRLPTPDETEKAMEAVRALAEVTRQKGSLPLLIRGDEHETVVELPPAVGNMVLDLLMHIGRGEAVTFVPFGAELTTQQAADLLNVSRPFLIKLIEKKELDCHMVGTHRRIKASDVLAYRERRNAEQESALQTLARLGQEIDADEAHR